MIRSKPWRWIGGLGLALVVLSIGCGKGSGNHASVRGEVKLDGKPLERGSILFVPIEGTKGGPAGGPIANGTYRLSGLDGPPIGINRVEIQAMRKSGKMMQNPYAPKGQGQLIELEVGAVAPRFNAGSILKAEIKPGDNTANFDVESE